MAVIILLLAQAELIFHVKLSPSFQAKIKDSGQHSSQLPALSLVTLPNLYTAWPQNYQETS